MSQPIFTPRPIFTGKPIFTQALMIWLDDMGGLVTFMKFSIISVISGISSDSGESTWPFNL